MSLKKRNGESITTYTGKRFYPLDPRPEDIDINDIMHALSNQGRFLGHSTCFYSTLQHCVMVSMMCEKEHALWGLVHDGSEAYLADIPSPLKHSKLFEEYRKIENNLMNVICDVFGLRHEQPENVHIVDKRMLATEARDLTIGRGLGWQIKYEPYDFSIIPWTPEVARVKFLSRLHELTVMKAKEV